MKWRVEFEDGGCEEVEAENSLIAAKEGSRKYNRGKQKHVKTLRAVRT